ncbi:ECF-type sigma factor [Aliikangiella maris]|uniref:ECF-type sigma factor n=2 Tax=Aliikangiella maris TaxID=3162458 RepID=A0ABV3MUA9_9GAMM
MMNLTQLIHKWQSGDKFSEEKLFSVTYEQFRRIAKESIQKQKSLGVQPKNIEEIIHSTTSLVHDAYIKISSAQTVDLKNSREFYMLVATTMRHILVDFFRKQNSKKRDVDAVDNKEIKNIPYSHELEDYLTLDKAIENLLDSFPRPAEILQLKYFFGFQNKEIADVLNISESTVDKDLKFARGWIKLHIEKGKY